MEKKTRNSGSSSAILTYLTSNADRPVTFKEIHDATGVIPSTISGSCRRLAERFPGQVVNKGGGVYVWTSIAGKTDEKVKGLVPGDLLLLRVLKISDGRMLVMNPDDTQVYTLKEIEW